jgi:hypothetical protein
LQPWISFKKSKFHLFYILEWSLNPKLHPFWLLRDSTSRKNEILADSQDVSFQMYYKWNILKED